jgi:hypothetical protein
VSFLHKGTELGGLWYTVIGGPHYIEVTEEEQVEELSCAFFVQVPLVYE